MKKLLASAIVISLIGFSGSTAFAANKEGAKCTTAGKIVTVSGKKLVCTKVAKTLKWVVVGKAVTTTTVAPTTTGAVTTTTTTIAVVKPVVTLLRAGGTSTSKVPPRLVTSERSDMTC